MSLLGRLIAGGLLGLVAAPFGALQWLLLLPLEHAWAGAAIASAAVLALALAARQARRAWGLGCAAVALLSLATPFALIASVLLVAEKASTEIAGTVLYGGSFALILLGGACIAVCILFGCGAWVLLEESRPAITPVRRAPEEAPDVPARRAGPIRTRPGRALSPAPAVLRGDRLRPSSNSAVTEQAPRP